MSTFKVPTGKLKRFYENDIKKSSHIPGVGMYQIEKAYKSLSRSPRSISIKRH